MSDTPLTPTALTAHIDQCARRADLQELGTLSAAAAGVPGMIDVCVRSFLHHLMSHPSLRRYVEVGTHMGASAVSAGAGNSHVQVRCCDNFSQFSVTDARVDNLGSSAPLHVGMRTEDLCRTNLERHLAGRYSLHTGSSLEWELGGADVVYYDGDHEAAPTCNNILHLVTECRPRVLCLDDWWASTVVRGVLQAVQRLPRIGCVVRETWTRGWWNGWIIMQLDYA